MGLQIKKDTLTLSEIRNYWESEIVGGDHPALQRLSDEFRVAMETAWWSGSFPTARGSGRLELARKLFEQFQDEIAFATAGSDFSGPTTLEGLGLPRIKVQVPNNQPLTWTESSCATTYADLARQWSKMNDNLRPFKYFQFPPETRAYQEFSPVIWATECSYADFMAWVDTTRYGRPDFWLPRVQEKQSAKRNAEGNDSDQPAKLELPTRERQSLLKLVIGMALKKYRYDPKASKNSAVTNIGTDLRQLKIPLEEDTIRKYLNEAKELLDDYAVD